MILYWKCTESLFSESKSLYLKKCYFLYICCLFIFRTGPWYVICVQGDHLVHLTKTHSGRWNLVLILLRVLRLLVSKSPSYIMNCPLPPSPALLSHGLHPVVCSVCHSAAKSSFHAIEQPQWLLQQQQQHPSVGEREENHSIMPDGERRNKHKLKKTEPKQLEGKLNQVCSGKNQKLNNMYFVFHKVKHKYWITDCVQGVHSRYCWT